MKISDVFPSKYLTAADLCGKPYTLTIKTVTLEEMMTHDNKMVQKPVAWFVGAQKGFVMNSTNAHIIVGLYGDDTSAWVGQRITIYPTKVKAFGAMQDCIRVREEIPAQPKPVVASAQVAEPSGLDDDEDVADFEENGASNLPVAGANMLASATGAFAQRAAETWDTATPSTKSPDDITPAQLLRLTVLMAAAYGTDWGALEGKLAADASKGSVTLFSDLKVNEAAVLIAKIETAMAQQQQSNGKVAA